MQYILFILIMLCISNNDALAKINIFACEPEWGSLAKEIVGDKAKIDVATTAKQDVHYIQAKPSLIASIRKADFLFCTGADLEVGWLPLLLSQGASSKIQLGSEGYFMAADYVKKLEIPVRLDRADGDIHPQGNPHIQTDPRNIAIIAPIFMQKISQIDPNNADYYKANYDNFAKKWQESIDKWEKQAQNFKHVPFAVQHNNWIYLTNWLELNIVTKLEEKPGLPITSSHLAEVLTKVKAKPIKAIIRAPYEDKKPADWLSSKTGAKIIDLPFTVGGNQDAKDLFSLFDSTILLLTSH